MDLNKNETGFSLFEVVVAAGLLGVLSLFVMKITSQQQQSQKTAVTAFEIRSLSSEISQILLSAKGCRNTFKDLGSIENGKSFTAIKNRNGTEKISVGDEFNNVAKITNLKLQDLSFGDPTPKTNHRFAEGKVRATFKKLSKMAQGGDVVTEDFPVKFEVDSSYNVVDCYSTTENAVGTAKKESCENIGGTYDSGTEQCDLSSYPPPSNSDGDELAISYEFLEEYIKDQVFDKSCGQGKFAIGIDEDGNIICKTARGSFSDEQCGDDEVFVGFDENGEIECRSQDSGSSNNRGKTLTLYKSSSGELSTNSTSSTKRSCSRFIPGIGGGCSSSSCDPCQREEDESSKNCNRRIDGSRENGNCHVTCEAKCKSTNQYVGKITTEGNN